MKSLRHLILAGSVLATTATSVLCGTRLWSGAAGDALWSTGGNWSPAGIPGFSDNLMFTNEGATDSSLIGGGAVNNVVDASQLTSVNSLGYLNTVGFHNTQVINTLGVHGTSATDVASIADDGEPSVLFVGSNRWQDGKDDSVYATIIGSFLTLTNANANLGVTQISSTAGAHRATLDLTGLDSFSCLVAKVLVGQNFTQPDHAWRPTGELFLARSNSITTQVIIVSDAYQNAGGTSYLHLGQVNTLNADRIGIGMHKCVGVVDFAPGLASPSVIFRNSAGTGRQTAWELGDEFEERTDLLFGFYTSNQARGTMDLTGALVDALVDRIILGRGQIQRDATQRTGDGNGALIFGGGAIDANYLEMGIQVPGPFIGGSVGNGILTVNNDPGVGPASLTVRSNLVMAVQQPGNTDPNGSTAVITVNDGSTLAVGGDIVAGGGHSTINLNNGGKLEMSPAGDATPGNVFVETLNITDEGVITNYATLSVMNLTLAGSSSQFTVYPGQVIAPAGVGAIGILKVTGDLVLRGDMLMEISKKEATLSADLVDATGSVDLGGTLTVTLSGNTKLTAGDKFTLFKGSLVNSLSKVTLPPPGTGLAWSSQILIDGSIEVIASGEPTTPPTLAVTMSPEGLHLTWPQAYTSFVLRGQTNASTLGLGSHWELVPGVVGNQVTIPINLEAGSAFFQLFQQ